MSSGSSHPSMVWLLVGIIVLLIAMILQIPAAWIVARFAPDTAYIDAVDGNLWQGQAAWHVPNQPLSGLLTWQWQPWRLILGQVSADVQVSSGDTQLAGVVGAARSSWQLKDMQGNIDHKTLATLVDWQLPSTPIQINQLSLKYATEGGFSDADGQLVWAGGQFGYPINDNKVEQINLPPMQASLTQQDQKIRLNMVDDADKRLADIYLDNELMLDVQLTQRLLENMPTYQGQAADDTAVVSVRQPLSSLMQGGL